MKVFFERSLNLNDFFNYVQNSASIDCFDFYLEVKDPAFYGYTELPIGQPLSYRYESNSKANQVNGAQVFMVPTPEAQSSNFAEVKIYFEDLSSVAEKPLTYNIDFKARATQWNYYIINQSQMDLKGLAIKSTGAVAFDGPEAVLLESGQEALLFSSGAQNLFLSQVPKYQFNLVKQLEGTTAKPQKIFVGLPSPDPLQLQVREDNGLKRVCSPMYVYV